MTSNKAYLQLSQSAVVRCVGIWLAAASIGAADASESVTRCIALAGIPFYPTPTLPGVESWAIDADSAISACQLATSEDPEDGYLWYLLGRAYSAKGDADKARVSTQESIAIGFAGAAFAQALIDFEPTNFSAPEASALLERAGDDGFYPAEYILAEQDAIAGNLPSAMSRLEPLIEMGYPPAETLQALLLTADNTNFDAQRAKNLLTLAADKGHTDAVAYLADFFAVEGAFAGLDHNLRDFDAAEHLYELAAQKGSLSSQHRVAVQKLNGQSHKDFPGDPIALLRSASDRGYLPATQELAIFLIQGRFLERNVQAGAKLLVTAADSGSPSSKYLVGQAYLSGTLAPYLPKSSSLGLTYLRQASALNNAEAKAALASHLLANSDNVEQAKEARQLMHEAAELGLTSAQAVIGEAYLYGTMGTDIDYELAWTWLSEAHTNGSSIATFYLAQMLESGKHVEPNPEEAFEYYLAAAEKGISEAYFVVGVEYWSGNVVPKDEAAAIRWLEKGVEAGNVDSMFALGNYFLDGGETIGLDYTRAARYLTLAGDAGLSIADQALGMLYRDGQLPDTNRELAIKHFRRAAQAGDSYSQYMLGEILLNNRQNDNALAEEGIEWLVKATQSDEPDTSRLAKLELGSAYEAGKGVHRDFEQAVDLYLDASFVTHATNLLIWGDDSIRDESRAVQLLEECHRTNSEPFCANSLGLYYNDQALEVYDPRKAARWFQKAAERKHVPSLLELANMYTMGYGVNPSIPRARELLTRASKLNSNQDAYAAEPADLILANATFELRIGNYAEAEEYYRQGLLSTTDTDDAENIMFTIISMGHLGILYTSQSRFHAALGVAKELRAGEYSDPVVRQIASFWASLIRISAYIGLGERDRAKAIVLHDPVINLLDDMGTSDTQVAAFSVMKGMFLVSLEEYRKAIPMLESGLPGIAATFGDRSYNYISALGALGFANARVGNLKAAQKQLGAAVAAADESGFDETLEYFGAKAELANTIYSLGDAATGRQLAKDTVVSLMSRMSSRTQSLSLGTVTERRRGKAILERYVELVLSERKPEDPQLFPETFGFAQEVNALNVTEGITDWLSRMTSPSADSATLLEEFFAKREQFRATDRAFQSSILSTPEHRESLRRSLEILKDEVDQLAIRLDNAGIDTLSLADNTTVSLETVQAVLHENELLVLYIAGERGSYAWAVSKNKTTLTPILLTGDEIRDTTDRLRQSLNPTAQDPVTFPYELAGKVYKQVVEPIVSRHSDVNSLTIVPDDAFLELPFAVLRTSNEDRKAQDSFDDGWLIATHALSISPSVSSFVDLRVRVSRSKALRPFVGIGNPIFAKSQSLDAADNPTESIYNSRGLGDLDKLSQLSPLPDTETELKEIGRILGASPSDIYLQSDATESTVKKLPLDQYKIVVFATHGLLASDSLGNGEPALVLTLPERATPEDDGLLNASEVRQLKLDADLVVLSACDTAAGGPDSDAMGLSGLAQAFFSAGTRSILVSNWPVISEAAAEITTSMFQLTHESGDKDFPRALQLAILQVLEKADTDLERHPVYWAPFVLIGQ